MSSRLSIRAALACVAALSIAILTACSGSDGNALGVNAVMTDPTAFKGQIAVKGVVQNLDPASSVISIIDEAEFASCGLTPCSSAGIMPLFLPLSADAVPSAARGAALYTGSWPALKDVVVVVGEIKSSPNGLYFDVERVERAGSVLLKKR
jgi:hypothetical protein